MKCEKKVNKLGLSWAKLSYQLGFACALTIICCIISIIMEQFLLVLLQEISFMMGKESLQAGAELGQAQLPIGIGLYCD